MAFFDSTKPLGLPGGSVRAIMALVFTATLAFMFATQAEVSDPLLALSSMIVGYYFAARTAGDAAEEAAIAKPYIPGDEDTGN